ncbi:uncharacterized protein Tco025E_04147 [Trypanosoma conorhini]|uniref:PH domain-containing protein n=1 Tax=Trypanosoma conorhini TaxID=83891 RepID=A0A3R7S200_9TRYP|nr:uncharacterized protein Tco025E_04147 [Trypanosoma conorhini]RNF19490.1 hypothetical protein Tco025E_04147 [Trypanosoma conorhini]
MRRENEDGCQVWGTCKETEAVSTPLTPGRLPPSAHLISAARVDTTRERLALLHAIVQRSLQHAEIPSRSANKVRPTSSTPDRRGSSPSATGETAYLNCMEQLLLAQFEGLGRRDIRLEQAESYAAEWEKWCKSALLMMMLQGAQASSSLDVNVLLAAGLATSEGLDCNESSAIAEVPFADVVADIVAMPPSFFVSEALRSLPCKENNERQTLSLEETSEFNALILGVDVVGHHSAASKRRDEVVGAPEEDADAWLRQANDIARLLLRWEAEEVAEAKPGEPGVAPAARKLLCAKSDIPVQTLARVAPTASLEVAPRRESVGGVRERWPSPSDESAEVNEEALGEDKSSPKRESMMGAPCRQPQNEEHCGVSRALAMRPALRKPAGAQPCIAGWVYRSCVPHAMWQLRFHRLEDGVLRFSKPSPSGKHVRWWTVLTIRELLYVGLDDTNAAIGEANPPDCHQGRSCISIYFKKPTEEAPRRLRLCGAKQRDTLAWFFALRHATQRRGSVRVGRVASFSDALT